MTEPAETAVVTIPATNIVDLNLFEADRRQVYRDGHTPDDLMELAEVVDVNVGGQRESLLDVAKLALVGTAPEGERPAARQKREALERLQTAAEASKKGTFYSLVFDQEGSLTDIMRVKKMPLDKHLAFRTKQMADSVGYGPKGTVKFVNPKAVPRH